MLLRPTAARPTLVEKAVAPVGAKGSVAPAQTATGPDEDAPPGPTRPDAAADDAVRGPLPAADGVSGDGRADYLAGGTVAVDPGGTAGLGAHDPTSPAAPLVTSRGRPPAAAAPAAPPNRPGAAAVLFRFDRLLPWAGAAWAAGGLLFALVQVVRIVRMAKCVRRGRPAGPGLSRRVRELSAELGIRPVPAHVMPGLVSPVIWAATRPRLLWPEALPPGAPDESFRGLILHELAHVKRRDHWVGWLELAAGCLWWWNPLFWYVRHQLRENAELACDAWVVQTLADGPGGRAAYARASWPCANASPACPSHKTRARPTPTIKQGRPPRCPSWASAPAADGASNGGSP